MLAAMLCICNALVEQHKSRLLTQILFKITEQWQLQAINSDPVIPDNVTYLRNI
jgi:uncharacterized membrane protein YwzB